MRELTPVNLTVLIAPMRVGLLFMMMGLLASAGCRTIPEVPPALPSPPPQPPVRLIRPLDAHKGRVHSVNERLRFVVLDYSLQSLPAGGEVLEVVRNGEVIGEVKVTGPFRASTVGADIVRGDPEAGDVVRPAPVASTLP